MRQTCCAIHWCSRKRKHKLKYWIKSSIKLEKDFFVEKKKLEQVLKHSGILLTSCFSLLKTRKFDKFSSRSPSRTPENNDMQTPGPVIIDKLAAKEETRALFDNDRDTKQQKCYFEVFLKSATVMSRILLVSSCVLMNVVNIGLNYFYFSSAACVEFVFDLAVEGGKVR